MSRTGLNDKSRNDFHWKRTNLTPISTQTFPMRRIIAHRPRHLALALLGSLMLSGPLRAANLPDLGDASEATLTRQAERTLGEQTMRSLQASGALLDDPEVNAYLDSLGRRLLQADPSLAGQPFDFFAVESSELNAFALPGGHVGVHTGLILATQSESELASVMAHEIAHVTQHHIARQIAGQSGAQLASMAALGAAILAAATGNGQVAMAAVTGATAANLQSQINYTREHESEADRIGFQLLTGAGFDPRAMASFFDRLQKATRLVDGNVPSYLRTHPLTHERIAEAEDRAFNLSYKQVRDSDEYHFVRALLRSYEGEPREAVALLDKALAEGRTQNARATRYGLTAALLRAGDFKRADKELAVVERGGPHPMVEALAGQILLQSGRLPEARKRYESALQRFPDHLQLVYDYPRTLIRLHDEAAAARFTESRLLARPQDPTLHRLAAEAFAALGQQTRSHVHQGEFEAARGNTQAAIEQYRIALRSADGSERDLTIADARLRELQAQQRELRKDGRDGGKDPSGGRLHSFTPR